MDSFVLYRFPHQKQYTKIEGSATILQHYSDLGSCRGFAVAPFSISKECPLVLIVPQHIYISKVEHTGISQPVHHDTVKNNKAAYMKDFSAFHEKLSQGVFKKIVLARTADITTNTSTEQLFMQACNLYPRLFIALVSTPVTGTWLTATPEILIDNDGHNCHTMALAGTMKVGDIKWSDKNIEEQRVVAQYIANCISAYTDNSHEEGPYSVRAGQVTHLRSDFTFQLKDKKDFGRIIAQLHPTPAVCGLPKDETYRFIQDVESIDRRYYSGFMGPVDIDGETHLYVTLRCMSIDNGHCRLYAGGGLLKESEAESEWLETETKMETMKRTIYAQQQV